EGLRRSILLAWILLADRVHLTGKRPHGPDRVAAVGPGGPGRPGDPGHARAGHGGAGHRPRGVDRDLAVPARRVDRTGLLLSPGRYVRTHAGGPGGDAALSGAV